MSPGVAQAGRWARQGLLTGGAVLGVICLLMTVGAILFGLRPLVFQSGSMAPAIRTGDLAVAHRVDAAGLAVGQVVSVPTATGSRVTHRIVSVDRQGDRASLVLRGDANRSADASTYPVTHADVVLFHVPRLGYVVAWLSSPLGIFLLGLYAAFLVSVLVRRPASVGDEPVTRLSPEPRTVPPARRHWPSWRSRSRRWRSSSSGVALLLVAGGLAGAAATHRVTPTAAAWTDGAGVTGTQLTAYTVPPPPSVGATCTPIANAANQTQGVVLAWPTSDPTVTYVATASALVDPAFALSTSGGTTSLTVTYNATTTANRGVTVAVGVQATTPVAAGWTSAATTVGSFVTDSRPNQPPTCS